MIHFKCKPTNKFKMGIIKLNVCNVKQIIMMANLKRNSKLHKMPKLRMLLIAHHICLQKAEKNTLNIILMKQIQKLSFGTYNFLIQLQYNSAIRHA